MNPAVAKSLAPAVEKTVGILIKAGFVVAAYFVLNKFLKQQQRKNQLNKFDNDPSIKVAMDIKQALNPSGNTWLQSMDGTNEKMLLEAGKNAGSFSDVIEAYRKLGYGDLDKDLQSELDNEDYSEFLKAVSKIGAGVVVQTPYKYQDGGLVEKAIDVNVPVMRIISNKSSNQIEMLSGTEGNNWQMRILQKGQLTINHSDASKVIENFYKVTFNYDGYFSNKIMTGWINEKYLRPYTGAAINNSNGVPFKYDIGDKVFKKEGEVRLTSEPTKAEGWMDTILNNEDNSKPLEIIALDRLKYKSGLGEDLITNYYKIRFSSGWLFPTDTEKWIWGESISSYKNA